MAERIRGEDPDEDVDAFLKESRDSLHGKYWGPDSLVPVRLVDMRDEPPPAPIRKRARVRPLDVVVGAVGVGAVIMIGLSLRDEKQPAPSAVVHKPTPTHVAVARKVVARPAAPPPPVAVLQTVPPVPEEPRSVEPAPTEAAPAPSTAPSSAVAAAEPSAAPKKRRPKPAASHTPPTASFPD